MFQGSMVALVTPMKAGVGPQTERDSEALRRLLEFHIEAGTDAIVAVGTTGESATLPEKEHCEVIREVVELVAGRVPVIAGTGANHGEAFAAASAEQASRLRHRVPRS